MIICYTYIQIYPKIFFFLCYLLTYRKHLVRDATTALWCSNRGMSESELVELLDVNILLQHIFRQLIMKSKFGSSLPPVVCRRAHVLFTIHYLDLFAYSGVQHILCCVFFCFFSVLCTLYMLPVSLDCPFLIAPSVFSNIFHFISNILLINSISGLTYINPLQ